MNLRIVDVLFVTAVAIVVTMITISIIPSNKADDKDEKDLAQERFLAPASEPVLVDSFNFPLTKVTMNEQVLVQSEITNTQNRTQTFVYIVQVKDSDGITVSLSWISSSLSANDRLNAAQSWIPQLPGNYDAEVFVWDSIEGKEVLSPVRKISVKVEQ
jgi:hypothetical protein